MSLTTADLPSALRVDPLTIALARAARAAGLTLGREACTCVTSRPNCPTCLSAVVRALPTG